MIWYETLMRANAAFYRVMLGQNGDPVFVGKVRQFIEKRMRRAPGGAAGQPSFGRAVFELYLHQRSGRLALVAGT
jgi:hypothetical protein